MSRPCVRFAPLRRTTTVSGWTFQGKFHAISPLRKVVHLAAARSSRACPTLCQASRSWTAMLPRLQCGSFCSRSGIGLIPTLTKTQISSNLRSLVVYQWTFADSIHLAATLAMFARQAECALLMSCLVLRFFTIGLTIGIRSYKSRHSDVYQRIPAQCSEFTANSLSAPRGTQFQFHGIGTEYEAVIPRTGLNCRLNLTLLPLWSSSNTEIRC